MVMAKLVAVREKSAALWTPWGLQRPAERQAQQIAIRRLVRRMAIIMKRAHAKQIA